MKIFNHPKKQKIDKAKEENFRDRLCNDPFVDWPIILISSLILIVIVAIVGVYTYIGVGHKLEEKANAPVMATKVLDPVLLDYVLNQFDRKALERQAILKQYEGPGDPSL